jgi:hypothetical protein
MKARARTASSPVRMEVSAVSSSYTTSVPQLKDGVASPFGASSFRLVAVRFSRRRLMIDVWKFTYCLLLQDGKVSEAGNEHA